MHPVFAVQFTAHEEIAVRAGDEVDGNVPTMVQGLGHDPVGRHDGDGQIGIRGHPQDAGADEAEHAADRRGRVRHAPRRGLRVVARHDLLGARREVVPGDGLRRDLQARQVALGHGQHAHPGCRQVHQAHTVTAGRPVAHGDTVSVTGVQERGHSAGRATGHARHRAVVQRAVRRETEEVAFAVRDAEDGVALHRTEGEALRQPEGTPGAVGRVDQHDAVRAGLIGDRVGVGVEDPSHAAVRRDIRCHRLAGGVVGPLPPAAVRAVQESGPSRGVEVLGQERLAVRRQHHLGGGRYRLGRCRRSHGPHDSRGRHDGEAHTARHWIRT